MVAWDARTTESVARERKSKDFNAEGPEVGAQRRHRRTADSDAVGVRFGFIIRRMSGFPSRAGYDPYLRMHCVNVYVRDQDRSLRFYLDQLGFHLAFDTRLQTGERWVAVAPPDGTAILALVAARPDTAQYKLIGRSTQVVFITEDVTAKFVEWSKRGVKFSHTPRLKRIQYDRATLGSAREGHAHDGEAQMQHSGTQSMLLGEHPTIWGGVYTRFRDVDGNSFSLVSFDEVTQAVEAQRRAVAEKLETERRAARELEIAKEVQARLFPQKRPVVETLDYAGVCIQARQVGGDYYDFLDLGPKRLGMVIGDVVGKGIAAALLMANLQANLRSQCAIALDRPRDVLRAVNRLFCENTPVGGFATLFFCEYEQATGRLRYVNCGHLCALLLRVDHTVERLDATGTVLGLFEDWDCEMGERTICSGDMLALYTDGITEAFNHAEEEFGEERLVEVLHRNRELASTALLDAVVAEVRRFSPQEQRDDVTMIVAKCR
jgi:serine phosphatase RsbU (regulator of sigma subunit)/catechol 2,3-dioxygenase-like lactoylglutathione lyase family enzyme